MHRPLNVKLELRTHSFVAFKSPDSS